MSLTTSSKGFSSSFFFSSGFFSSAGLAVCWSTMERAWAGSCWAAPGRARAAVSPAATSVATRIVTREDRRMGLLLCWVKIEESSFDCASAPPASRSFGTAGAPRRTKAESLSAFGGVASLLGLGLTLPPDFCQLACGRLARRRPDRLRLLRGRRAASKKDREEGRAHSTSSGHPERKTRGAFSARIRQTLGGGAGRGGGGRPGPARPRAGLARIRGAAPPPRPAARQQIGRAP